MNPVPFIAKRLRELREHHGLTQEQAAALTGVGYKFYQTLESGRKKQVWVETVARYATAYGIGLHEFFAPDCPKAGRIKVVEPRAPHRTKGEPK